MGTATREGDGRDSSGKPLNQSSPPEKPPTKHQTPSLGPPTQRTPHTAATNKPPSRCEDRHVAVRRCSSLCRKASKSCKQAVVFCLKQTPPRLRCASMRVACSAPLVRINQSIRCGWAVMWLRQRVCAPTGYSIGARTLGKKHGGEHRRADLSR